MVGSAVAIRTVSSAARKRVVLSARKAKCFLTGGLHVGMVILSEKLSESVLVGRSEDLRNEEEVGFPIVVVLCCVGKVVLTMMDCCLYNFGGGPANL